MPCSRPPLDSTSVPSAINALPPASAAGARRAPAREPHGRLRRAHEHDDRAEPAADAGERAGQHAEVVLADRDAAVGGDRAVDRRREHHADRDAGEHEQARCAPGCRSGGPPSRYTVPSASHGTLSTAPSR